MGAGAVGLVLILLFGRDVASYITTSADQVSGSIRSQIPVEFEIERARKMIADLTPEIRDNMVAIAREEIEVERLDEQIEDLETRLQDEKATLSYLKEGLESGRNELKVGTTLYTNREATNLAETRFTRFRTQHTTLKNLQRTKKARCKGLNAAGKKLDELIAAKEQLSAEVANLEARQKMNDVARMANDQSQFDDGRLARTRQLIREIETRVRVEERLTATELHFMEEVVPVVEGNQASQDITARIADYFTENGSEIRSDLLVDVSSADTSAADSQLGDTAAY